MNLLSLKCPRCQGDLEGDNNSRVFFCRGCVIGVDLSLGREREFAVECARAALPRDEEMEYFPFWMYSGSYVTASGEKDESVSHESTFWVPAFFIKSISYFGDIGLFYTSRKIRPRMEQCRAFPIFPADRGEADASVYPLVYASCMESSASIQVVDVNVNAVSLVLVPFFRVGVEFLDSQLGWAYPSGALI